MRVLLCPPTFRYANEYPAFLSFSDFPSGFGYLASSLKQAGHEVFGCNPNNIVGYASAYLMLQDTLLGALAKTKPDLIGLGGLCTDYRFLKDAIGIIRQNSRIPIVLGGQIVTNDAEFIFKDLKPDFAIVGEGEEPFTSLVDTMTYPMGSVAMPPNLWYWEPDASAHFTGADYRYSPIDELPFPDYEPFGITRMLDDYSDATRVLYRYSRPDARPFNLVASRSCPYNCSFCIHHHRAIPYRARSIENVMAELKSSYEQYRFNVLILLDELFAVNKQRMDAFSRAILEGRKQYGWDFDWVFQTHANARLDGESLRLAKQAGCYLFSYGLESASPAVLKSMNKKTNIAQVTETIKLAEEVGIGFSANLIFGDVAETRATVAESLAFWLKYGVKSDIFMDIVRPYPGSKLFDICLERKLIGDKKDYYEHIDEKPINMTNMSYDEFEKILSLLGYLEKCWLFVRSTTDVNCIMEAKDGLYQTYYGGDYYRIISRCPYCGELTEHKQLMTGRPFFLGTGCTKCQRKIKVEVQ